MKCFNCGSKNYAETSVLLEGGIRARAWKCGKCGETILDPEAAQKALLLNKLKKGIEVTVGQLGNSLVMRFPAEIAQLTGLKKGKKITVYPQDEKKMVVSTA